jgi:hypothetical protein
VTPENCGAIFTAVCCLLVVAPPISSGRSDPGAPSPRHVRHLVERGRDQPAQADDVHPALEGLVEDAIARDHHAEVDHLVVVAAEHHADDVLADVVDVALDRGQQHPALRRRRLRRPSRPP